MKKIILLILLCCLTAIAYAQVISNDSLKIDELNKRIITLEQNINNASLEFDRYQRQIELSKALLIIGGTFSLYGTFSLCDELKNPNNQNFTTIYTMFGISSVFIIASIFHTYRAHHILSNAGFNLGVGLNRIQLIYTF